MIFWWDFVWVQTLISLHLWFVKPPAIIISIRIPSQNNAQKHCFVKVSIFRVNITKGTMDPRHLVFKFLLVQSKVSQNQRKCSKLLKIQLVWGIPIGRRARAVGGQFPHFFLKIRNAPFSQHISLKGSIDLVNVPQVDCFAQSTIALFSKYNSMKVQFFNNLLVTYWGFAVLKDRLMSKLLCHTT